MRRVAGRLFTCGILVVFLSGLAGCQGTSGSQQKVTLFNSKDLSGWKPFASDSDIPVEQIWSVRGGVIHCTGQRNGYMRTERKYGNYRLHVEWRWPGEPSNSGVLLHASGRDKVWPRCIECQLQAGNAGDFVLIGGTGLTQDGQKKQDTSKAYVILPKKQPGIEKEPGQWNTYEIVCFRDQLQCLVNGVLQNEGRWLTDTAGWIGLQSEGGPIEFRNITVEPVR